MKLLIIACLVAVCAATVRIPPVPVVPESFCMEGEIEFHRAERTDFGNFNVCRDQVNQMEMEADEYPGTSEIFETLLRYDGTLSHMAYYIRGRMDGLHCITEKRNVTSKLPPFFDWAKLAVYEGLRDYHNIKYDLWGLTVADVRFELLVAQDSPNIPVLFNRKEAEDFVQYSIRNFNATIPDSSVFRIPKPCTEN